MSRFFSRFVPALSGIFLSFFTFTIQAEDQSMNKLSDRQRAIIPIAAFTANGDMEKLKTSLAAGLDAGLTVNEIKEVLVQMYAYCGFPRSLNGLNNLIEVLKERRAKGIGDVAGKTASPRPAGQSIRELGTAVQTELVGRTVSGEVYEFAPAIDVYLKEHLFGDIFASDVLDHRNRELATISALVNLGGAENQLRSHLSVSLNAGLTEGQLRDYVDVLNGKVGAKQADTAAKLLETVLNDRDHVLTRADDTAVVQAPPNVFTGKVMLKYLFAAKKTAPFSGAYVNFEPGARSYWHTHPAGQHLVVVAGVGRTGTWNGNVHEIREGDVVWCPPGVKHWHGASPDSAMTHLALTGVEAGSGVTWLEAVTDEQYNKAIDKQEKFDQ